MVLGPTTTASLSRQVVGNVGLYYVCYRLSCLGWNVMPTSRNARGIDIVAYSPDASRFRGLQVKTLSKRDPVPLGADITQLYGDYFVVVTGAAATPTCYVLLPSEVQKRAHRGEKNGKISYWLQPGAYEQSDFREAWGRIS